MDGGAQWRVMAGFRRDRSITQKQLNKGTTRRILRFARPYRRWLLIFLGLIQLDDVLSVANPLILKKIIDDGVAPGAPEGDPGLVVRLALLVGAIALVSELLALIQRCYPARIGEGLIYEMRSQVFDHVQR